MEFLDQLRKELVERTYRPQRARKVEIPKGGGKMRQLSIPSIRDRVVQGAMKLILEPIFEADFQPGSFGYRPKKSAHAAIQRARNALLEGKTYVNRFGFAILLRHGTTSFRTGEGGATSRGRCGFVALEVATECVGEAGSSARRGDFAAAQQSVPQ